MRIAPDPRRVRRLAFVLAIVGALALAGAAYLLLRPPENRAPDFTLTDQHGRPFSLAQARGRPVVLFFGYAHCPDVCPLTLAHLAQAVRATPAADRPEVVFVTVDPQRDGPAAIGRYVALFDPRFVGLTGTEAELAPVYAAYHVWHQRIAAPKGSRDYQVAHGSATYYIDRRGVLRGLGDWQDAPATIERDFKEYLS